MENYLRYFLLLFVFFINGMTLQAEQVDQKLETTIDISLDYLLYLPADYDSKESWPLLMFLHGAGERGNDLEKVKVHGPPKLISKGKEFPMIVVSPQCPEDDWWNPLVLSALLDSIEEQYKVDKNRIYITGLSMGGYGTWSLVAQSPERFAAIVPICGAGVPGRVKLHSHVPAWVFHGKKDSVIPVARSLDMVEAYEKNKGKALLTIYPEADHDSWTETYNNPKLYEWLLMQKRSN